MIRRSVIVYWGPGLSGKSTNLSVVREILAGHASETLESGQVVRVVPDRVLFDLVPDGLQLELFAPPGQAHHRKLREESTPEVDGVVFVADSSAAAVSVNLAALDELEIFVASRHQDLRELPLVFQYNKRDLNDALALSRLDELLNPSGRPCVEAIARRGIGVFPTLKALAVELQARPRSIHPDRVAVHQGDALIGEEVPHLGDAGGGGRATAMDLEPGVSLRRGEALEPSPDSTANRAKWPLLLAGLLGAVARELVSLGWRITGEGG